MSMALTWGFLICAVSQTVGTMLSVSPMLFASAFAVVAATVFPKAMGNLSAAGGVIGVLAMQVSACLRVSVLFCIVLLMLEGLLSL